jgi:hypothetical protein
MTVAVTNLLTAISYLQELKKKKQDSLSLPFIHWTLRKPHALLLAIAVGLERRKLNYLRKLGRNHE